MLLLDVLPLAIFGFWPLGAFPNLRRKFIIPCAHTKKTGLTGRPMILGTHLAILFPPGVCNAPGRPFLA